MLHKIYVTMNAYMIVRLLNVHYVRLKKERHILVDN